MKPIADLPADVAKRLQGVLFDIDDTVLDHGRLSQGSLEALYRLKADGLLAVGVTGRPVTWGQVLVRQWPVDGMVTENGALWVITSGKRVLTLDRLTATEREQRRRRLLDLVADVRTRFPEVEPADDADSRLSDSTFDIGETVTVPSERVSELANYARSRGARVTRSSIHLHVSYDIDDKASGVLRFLSQVYGKDPTASRHDFAFIGDSENDAPCFAAFRTTVGVANFRGRPSVPPQFLTSGMMGTGFAEFVSRVIERRHA
jgi:HAD superfamily hydrolase (TIGR01484 family)